MKFRAYGNMMVKKYINHQSERSTRMKKEKFEKMMDKVTHTLQEAGGDRGRRHAFRLRSRHTRRVWKWAQRLSEGRSDVDTDVLYTAVIFHDVGYVEERLENHQILSEKIFLAYAKEQDWDETFAEKVAACIRIHSDKWRMQTPEDLTIEQLLLMEADLLDEEGALAICWDGLACGITEDKSYAASLERTRREFADKLENNPMVTERARRIWQEKQEFVRQYLSALTYDLEEA